MLKRIEVEFIPGDQQRYETVGDWYYSEDGETLIVKISNMSRKRREFMVLLHELTELILCSEAGITAKQVDDYDKTHPDAGGDERDMADAPYVKQHGQAITIERMLGHFLGEDWVDYEHELDTL